MGNIPSTQFESNVVFTETANKICLSTTNNKFNGDKIDDIKVCLDPEIVQKIITLIKS